MEKSAIPTSGRLSVGRKDVAVESTGNSINRNLKKKQNKKSFGLSRLMIRKRKKNYRAAVKEREIARWYLFNDRDVIGSFGAKLSRAGIRELIYSDSNNTEYYVTVPFVMLTLL